MKNKISKTRYEEIKKDWEEIEKEAKEAREEFIEAQASLVMDNCEKCKGTGQVEEGYGDPAHTTDIIYRECPDCEGKGYIE